MEIIVERVSLSLVRPPITLILFLIGIIACSKPTTAPKPTPIIKKTDTSVISARSSKPGDARAVLLVRPQIIHEIRFSSLPAEIVSDQEFQVLAQVVDKAGKPVADDSRSLGISLIAGPPGHLGFTGGQLNAPLRASVAEFSDLKLRTPGAYRFRVSLSGHRVESGPILVVSAKPKKVKLIVNGVTEGALFEPPSTYVLSDGDRFEKVPRGKSKFSYEGIDYDVDRLNNDDVILKTIGKTKNAPK